MIRNLLSSNEISDILNNPTVKINKEKLSTLQKVDFSIPLSDLIINKLETGFNINLTHITSIPMRWIRGDTTPHIDKGEKHFDNTHLLYLTDSIGNLMIDGKSYPITAGDAHIFSEGIEHYTINTEESERLMIGPMSEIGFRVGAPTSIIYYNNEADATAESDVTFYGISNAISTSYYDLNYILDGYTIQTINGISSWNIYTNNYGTEPTPNGGPYNTGDVLTATGTYFLYPYVSIISTPVPTTTQTHSFSMRSLYSNNAQVYYKPHSLSTGGGGSGVTNCRHKQRKT